MRVEKGTPMAYKQTLSWVAFLLAFMSVGWSGRDCKMTGRVVDATGAGVSNASVVVYTWSRGNAGSSALQNVGSFVTDGFGEFHASFPAGTYDILAASRGLLPTAARVRLTSGATGVSLQLQMDPAQPIEGC